MMDRAIRRSILLSISLAAATVLGAVLRPHASTATSLPAIDLQQMVPATFADWRLEAPHPSAGVTEDVQAEIDKVYSQVLDRTYVNAGGQRVMLSIAYGRDQETGTQLHRPEFCYEAQGFQVSTSQDGSLATGFGKIPVRHMIAMRGARVETVTYWITVGNRVTLPGIGRKLAQLSYGLSGLVPDGMVVRVSTLSQKTGSGGAYRLQERFVQDMMSAVDGRARQRLTGGADL
jgi:EpsI family protein